MKITYRDHIEAIARAFGVFGAVFISARWTGKSAPKYDHVLLVIAAIMGVILGIN